MVAKVDASLSSASLYAALPLQDLWEDARMDEVMIYLRGNTHLDIPDEFRPLLQQHL
jgi:hypothetical protein